MSNDERFFETNDSVLYRQLFHVSEECDTLAQALENLEKAASTASNPSIEEQAKKLREQAVQAAEELRKHIPPNFWTGP